MNAFDQAMNALDEKFSFLSSSKQIVSDMDEDKKVINYTIFSQGTSCIICSALTFRSTSNPDLLVLFVTLIFA
jgi:hypothetical protein